MYRWFFCNMALFQHRQRMQSMVSSHTALGRSGLACSAIRVFTAF
uniref:Uncharacterized protein n=1 Tax=Anguilla anguilla TaxID=7936 RepID=A0A0E9S0K6_ANGAN